MKKLIILSILCALTLSTYSQSKFNKKYNKEGCILGDCENGQGTYTWQDPFEEYEGEWKDGDYNGQGTYTYASGDKYVGQWKNDKYDGQGTYTYGKGEWEGDKYVGEYKDDLRNGQGTYTMADGTVYKGLWENGELLGN